MRYRLRNLTPDLLIILILLLMPLLTFWAQTLGGSTLIPAENLYQYEPYATYREQVGVPEIPYNALVSDTVLQNLQWKAFIKDSIAAGEVPLWNPHQLGGVPFMAAGQPSTLYPLSLIYYLAPLHSAYGWFVVVNLWLAGVMMYGYVRGLRLRRPSAAFAAIVYQLNGFLIAGAVFPMMIAGAVWLPLLLLMVEYIARSRQLFGRPAVVPWVVIGAGALGMNIFAGHVEITYYTILITAVYGLVRLIHGYLASRDGRKWSAKLGWMAALGVLGLALGAVQFVPLYELVSTNWRAQGKTFSETLGFAHPVRDVVQFVMPNFYGSPAQHSYIDVFTWERVPVDFINSYGGRKTNTEWGIKNYVEGALYLGILPLVLAAYAVAERTPVWLRRRKPAITPEPPTRATFTGLALVGLAFMFGTPAYALVYYGLPGLNQSHTPFRWIYAVMLSVAVLAAYGWERLSELSGQRLKVVFAWLLTATGLGTLVVLGLSYELYPMLETPVFARLLNSLAKANEAFPNARAFYSHIFWQVLTFGVITTLNAVFWWLMVYTVHRQRKRTRFDEKQDYWGGRRGLWARFRPGLAQIATLGAMILLGVDLMLASAAFNPRSEKAWLDFTPPSIAWLSEQPDHWRYITLDDPTQPPLFQANMTWRYGLDDVRGYESIIPKPYVDYMRELYPQVQLDFNRIAPLYTSYAHVGMDFDPRDALTDPRFHALNIRYVVTHTSTDISDVDGYTLAYEDEAVRIWENANALPRAFVALTPDDCVRARCIAPLPEVNPAPIRSDTGREMVIDLPPFAGGDTLIVLNSYFNGWRAYLQVNPNEEIALPVSRVYDNFVGVTLPDEVQGQPIEIFSRTFSVRLVYSPTSFQVGAFGSAIAGMLALFMLGVWAWRRFVVSDDADGGALLARNSVAPVILNLFNRGIDFVLAFVVLRVLGPEDTGIYYYAVVVFVWFDIFTNFGLDVYVMREVSRNRDRARYLFINTSVFRLMLSGVGVLLLLGFIFARQSLVPDPFETRGIIALVLLYLGLLPASLSKGMTSLYYAYERAEYPAGVSTVTSISKAVLGVAALLLGYGIIGLAAVSIFNNFVTLAILVVSGRDMLGMGGGRAQFIAPLHNENGDDVAAQRAAPVNETTRAKTDAENRVPTTKRGAVDFPLMRRMANESYPLMLNHFLATIFFQIDVVILEALRGAVIVGKYSVGYRWLLALNVIPAFFTMALFPRLSRQAADDRAALRRNYALSLKLLLAVVFPAAVVLTFWAEPLTLLLGGREFMPEGAIALQIMVWSMPFGWSNSLTQYVLIALDRQRQLTWAFAVGVTFNIVTNLIFIPIYGFRAAAVTTILSELILLIGFAVLLRAEVRGFNAVAVMWRPAVAAGAMSAALWLALPLTLFGATLIGAAVYVGVWLVLRPFSPDEWETLAPLLPGKLRGRVAPAG